MMISLLTGAAFMFNLAIEPWRAVNDGVMGGISSGQMSATTEGLLFHGTLSLENSGGFSSVRRLITEDLSQSRGMRLTIKGDKRTYQLRFREDDRFDGLAWRREFQTDGSVQTIEIEYAEFEAVFRGRVQRGQGSMDPAKIQQVGFLIADKQPGEFSLEILGWEVLL
ncbi:MAG: NADH dehydrogenase [ubiquinone] 1 alpha subcomplex assembly factor 1 [Rhodothermales bacterium]|jgi:NADH dehydrogenase [ubiquinone] 1 alpha subcomplex assembly factor 1